MNTVVLSVIGLDCPGVVHTVSDTLAQLKCRIEEVTQTILQNQFAAIFVVSLPEGLNPDSVEGKLSERFESRNMLLSSTIRRMEVSPSAEAVECEPFVVTVSGDNQTEIMASITSFFAEQGVNIENLKAIRPEGQPESCLLFFEIALPVSIDTGAFRRTLLSKAEDMGIHISVQHRKIFEAMHRVSSF